MNDFDGFEKKFGIIVCDVWIFTGWIDIHSQSDINTRSLETVSQSSGAAEQIHGIDFSFKRLSVFCL
jgi:hypothetical protein